MASVASPIRGQPTMDGLSVDDLRVALQGHLKRTGVLSSFKTQLRTVLLTHLLDNTSSVQTCDPTLAEGMSREVRQRAQPGTSGVANQQPNLFQRAIADAVVLDYLKQTDRTFSYSIFTSECEASTGVDPMQLSAFASAFPEGKGVSEQLAQVLHLSRKSNSASLSVAEEGHTGDLHRLSVLEQIVANLMDSSNSNSNGHGGGRTKHSSRSEQRGVQTVGSQQREWESVEELFHTHPLALADAPHIVRNEEKGGGGSATSKREGSREPSSEGVDANKQGIEFANTEASWKAPLEIRLARVDASFADAFARQQHSSRERVERELGKLKDALAVEARQEMQRQVEKFKQTEIERVRTEYQQRCEAVIEASRREASEAKEVLQRSIERQKATLVERENDLNEGFRRLHDKERLLLAQLEEKEREVRQAAATAFEEREQRHRFRRQCEQLQDILREKMEDVQALIEKIGRVEAGKKRANAEYLWELKLREDETEELKRANAILWRRLNDSRMQQSDKPPQERVYSPPNVQADLGRVSPSAVSNVGSATGGYGAGQREKWSYDDIQTSAYRVPSFGYSMDGASGQQPPRSSSSSGWPRSTSALHRQQQQYQEELENMLYHSEDDRRRGNNARETAATAAGSATRNTSANSVPSRGNTQVDPQAIPTTQTTKPTPEPQPLSQPQPQSQPSLPKEGQQQSPPPAAQDTSLQSSVGSRKSSNASGSSQTQRSTLSAGKTTPIERAAADQLGSEGRHSSSSSSKNTSKSSSSSASKEDAERTREDDAQNKLKREQEEKQRGEARQSVADEEQLARNALGDEQQTTFAAIQWSEKNNLSQIEANRATQSLEKNRGAKNNSQSPSSGSSATSSPSSSSSVSYEDDGWGGKRPKATAGKSGGSAVDRFPIQQPQDERYAGGDVLFQRGSSDESDESAENLLFGGNSDDSSDF